MQNIVEVIGLLSAGLGLVSAGISLATAFAELRRRRQGNSAGKSTPEPDNGQD